jgi:hypothetical protein
VNAKDLNDVQIAKLQEQTGRSLRWINHLIARMDRRGWKVDDPARLAALRAQDGLHALNVHLHYASVKSGVG